MDETDADKNLTSRLVEMLGPSTQAADLEAIPKRENKKYCPYLRLAQKKMNMNDWLVDGKIHNGAHFPQCFFTKGSSARSAGKQLERAQKAKNRLKDTQRRSSSRSRENTDQWDAGGGWDDSKWHAGGGWDVSKWHAGGAWDQSQWTPSTTAKRYDVTWQMSVYVQGPRPQWKWGSSPQSRW